MNSVPGLDTPGTAADWAHRERDRSDKKPLQAQYEAYCNRQISLLIEIVPREAVRPFYRSARTWATERGVHESKDPMSTLRVFCRELLPLPPFDVWALDHERYRAAHLDAASGWSSPRELVEPVAVEVRRLQHGGESWEGALEVYRGASTWRGLIRFQREGAEGYFRTGEIFCEDGLQDVRNRFISFSALTLSAFLRSTLP
jgi:hypothetical protein